MDILGLSNTMSNGSSAAAAPSSATEKSPAAPAAAGGAAASTGAKEISRQDLILLVQKLQKRAAAADQQVATLKKQLEETSSASPSNSSDVKKETSLVDLLTASPSPSSNSTSVPSPDIQSALAKQSSIHASQLTNLQGELAKKAEALEAATKKNAADTEGWKKKLGAAVEEIKKLQAQVASASTPTAASAAATAPPSASLSPSPAAVASPASGGGGSFLLENANKELKLALQAEQNKVATLQARCERYERESLEGNKSTQMALENTQKKLAETESKLSNVNEKLLKSFALITEEKKRTQTAQEEKTALSQQISHLQQAVESSKDLLSESQRNLEHSTMEANHLRTSLFKLQQTSAGQAMGEAEHSSDMREMKKTLLSKTEEVLALQNELDHVRNIHAKTLLGIEQDSQLQISQLEQNLDEEKANNERSMAENLLLKQTMELDRNKWDKEKQSLEERLESSKSETEQLHNQVSQYQKDLERLQSKFQQLQTESSESQSKAAADLQETQTKSLEKYQRLLQELKQYKIHTITTQHELKTQIEQLFTRNQALEEEIRSGKPSERKLFELATMQAQRDEHVREFERELESHRRSAVELRGQAEAARVEKEFLQSELAKMAKSQSRATVNLDYLKSVMVQFLSYENTPANRTALVPVIQQLLCFTEEDRRIVREAVEGSSINASLSSWWGSLSGKAEKKKITLPPSMPLGVNLDMHPSPFASGNATPQLNGAASSIASTPALSPEPSLSASASASVSPSQANTDALMSGSSVPPVELTGGVKVNTSPK